MHCSGDLAELEARRAENIGKISEFLTQSLGIEKGTFNVSSVAAGKSTKEDAKPRKASAERALIPITESQQETLLSSSGKSRMTAVVCRILFGRVHEESLMHPCTDPLCKYPHLYLVEWARYKAHGNKAPRSSWVLEQELLKNSSNLLSCFLRGRWSNSCDRCKDAGTLVCCGRCLRAFHKLCLLLDESENLQTDMWACPTCTFGVESGILPKILFDDDEEMECPKSTLVSQEPLSSHDKAITPRQKDQNTTYQPSSTAAYTPYIQKPGKISLVERESKVENKKKLNKIADGSPPHITPPSEKAKKHQLQLKRLQLLGVGKKWEMKSPGLTKKSGVSRRLSTYESSGKRYPDTAVEHKPPPHMSTPGSIVLVRSGPHSIEFTTAQVLEIDKASGWTRVRHINAANATTTCRTLAGITDRKLARGTGTDQGGEMWVPSSVFNFKAAERAAARRARAWGGAQNAALQGEGHRERDYKKEKAPVVLKGKASFSVESRETIKEEQRARFLGAFPHGLWDPRAYNGAAKLADDRIDWEIKYEKKKEGSQQLFSAFLSQSLTGRKLTHGSAVYVSRELAAVDDDPSLKRQGPGAQKANNSFMVGIICNMRAVERCTIQTPSKAALNSEQDEDAITVLDSEQAITKVQAKVEKCQNAKLGQVIDFEIEVLWMERGADIQMDLQGALPLDPRGTPLGSDQCTAPLQNRLLFLGTKQDWIPVGSVTEDLEPQVKYFPVPLVSDENPLAISMVMEEWETRIGTWIEQGPHFLYFTKCVSNVNGLVTFDTPKAGDISRACIPTDEGAFSLPRSQGGKPSRDHEQTSALRVLDLFCGVGGTGLGSLGMAAGCTEEDEVTLQNRVRIVAAVDNCPNACKAYAKNISCGKKTVARILTGTTPTNKNSPLWRKGREIRSGQQRSIKPDEHEVPVFQMDIADFSTSLLQLPGNAKKTSRAPQMQGKKRKASSTKNTKNEKEPSALVDLVIVTAPCQNYSGLNRSDATAKCSEDHLNNKALWDSWQVIETLRPKGVLMENVCGLVHFKDGRGHVLGRLVGALLGWGYSVRLEVHQVQYYGVPSRRRRLILQAALPGAGAGGGTLPPAAVQASADGWEFAQHPGTGGPVFSRRGFPAGRVVLPVEQAYPPWAQRAAREGALRWLDGAPCGEGDLELRMPFLTVEHAIGDLMDVPTVTAKESRRGAASPYGAPPAAAARPPPLGDAPARGGGFATAEARLESVRRHQRLCRLGSPRADQVLDHYSVGIEGRGHKARWQRLKWGHLGPTITGTLDPLLYRCVHPVLDRALTVREAARIQGFQDRATFVGASAAECYKQVANAVPPPLAYRLTQAWAQHLLLRRPAAAGAWALGGAGAGAGGGGAARKRGRAGKAAGSEQWAGRKAKAEESEGADAEKKKRSKRQRTGGRSRQVISELL